MQIEVRNTIAPAGAHLHMLAHELPHTVGRVGIVGADAISLGIVISFLDADLPVTLFEAGRKALDEVVAQARSGYEAAVARGEIGPRERDRRMALLAGTVNFHHLKDCDLIVDAVDTDTAGKETLFRRLDQVARPDAILATLAPDVSVDHVAGCTRRSRDVLGLHVSSSPDTGETWQIVPGRDTSSATLGTVIALARKLDKLAAVSDLCYGNGTDAKRGARDLTSAARSQTAAPTHNPA